LKSSQELIAEKKVQGIIVDLRRVDQIDKDFKKAKDLITWIADRLDDGRL
jgi:hypothetical protein